MLDIAMEKHQHKSLNMFYKPDTFTSTLKQLTKEMRAMRYDVVMEQRKEKTSKH